MPIPKIEYDKENIPNMVLQNCTNFGFCLLVLLYGNQQPKTTYCSTHVASTKCIQNPNLAKKSF